MPLIYKVNNQKYEETLKKPNDIFGFFFKHSINITLTIFAIVLLSQITISENIFANIKHFNTQIVQQEKNNLKLKENNKQLVIELNTLSDTKHQILESQARYKLGMIKKNETYYTLKNE